VSLVDNPDHCGACGNACEGVTPFCQGDTCVATCPLTDCQGACVDLQTDPRHCGDCAIDCGSAGTCTAGVCDTCAAPGVDCGGVCADTSSDPLHCGGCGLTCDPFTEACEAGDCACRDGLTDCDDTAGVQCRDTVNDAENCGGCGATCADGQFCQDSSCACTPPLVSDGAGGCTDPTSDPGACGDPPVTCSGDTPLCQEGACVNSCSDGLTPCDGACVDLDTHPFHCGTCGEAVGPEEMCIDGDARDIEIATGCNECPCQVCIADDKTCCAHPITGVPVCVDAPACP
jgi:hypothetical protein